MTLISKFAAWWRQEFDCAVNAPGSPVFIDADGVLPAVDGSQLTGVNKLLRASGVLQGYTTPATASVLTCSFNTNLLNGVMAVITVDGVTFTLGGVDTDSGAPWDPSGATNGIAVVTYSSTGAFTVDDVVSALNGTAAFSAVAVASDAAGFLRITTNNTGAGVTQSVDSNPLGYIGSITNTNGTDASGNIDEVELIPAVAGKKVKCALAWLLGDYTGATVQLALKKDGAFIAVAPDLTPDGTLQEVKPTADTIVMFFEGQQEGESLVARIAGSPSSGGTATFRVFAQQY